MSVRTTADERLDEAATAVAGAINCLKEVVLGECWGAEDYGEEAQETFAAVLHDLINVRRKLNRH